MITLSVKNSGKMTAKITAGGKTYSFTGSGFEAVEEDDCGLLVYRFNLSTKSGDVYRGAIRQANHDVKTLTEMGVCTSQDDCFFTPAGKNSYYAFVWRNEHGKDGRLSTDTSGKAQKVMDAIKSLKTINLADVDQNYGTVKMSIDTKGNVKFAGKTSDGFKVSGSTFLMLDDDWYHVIADMVFFDKKSGNVYRITPCWQPIFNQQGNIVDWDDECCDHSLRIYPFE